MSEENNEDQPTQKRSKRPMHLGNTSDDQQAADTAANYTLGPGHSVTDIGLEKRCPHGNKKAYACKKCHDDAVANGTATGRSSRYCISHGKPKSSCNGGTCQNKVQAESEYAQSADSAPVAPPEQSTVDTQIHLAVTGIQCQFCSDFNASPESRLCSNCIKITAVQCDIQAVDGLDDFITKQIAVNICIHGKKKAYVCRKCRDYAAKKGMKKKFVFCDHDRQKALCKECGGSSLCEHGKQIPTCVECGGSGVCEHLTAKTGCKECKENETGEEMTFYRDHSASSICEHLKYRSVCKECKENGTGGGSICDHDRVKSKCKECRNNGTGGGSFCDHDRVKSKCKECKENGTGGGSLCDHDRVKAKCKECKENETGEERIFYHDHLGSSICEHSKCRSVCRECKENGTGGGSLCDHDRIKSKCKECKKNGTGGGSFCDHDRIKSRCKECKASGVGGGSRCDHGRIKSMCKECGSASICEHSRYRSVCKECKEIGIGGGSICDHGKINSICKECKENGTGGSNICDHGIIKSRCKECKENATGGSSICDHARVRSMCKECKENGTGGGGLCNHNRRRARCRDCGDSTICIHIKHKQFCKDCGGSGVCSHGKVKYTCTACKSLGLAYGRKKRPRDGASTCYHGIDRNRCKDCSELRQTYSELANMGPIMPPIQVIQVIQPLIESLTEPPTMEDDSGDIITGNPDDESPNHSIQCPQCYESKDYLSFVLDECGMPSLYCQVCTKVINEGGGIVCSGGCHKFLFGQDASQLPLCQNCIDEQAMDGDCGLRPFGQLDEQIYCFNCSHYLPVTSFPCDVDRDNRPCCIECKILIDHASSVESAESAEHGSSASGMP